MEVLQNLAKKAATISINQLIKEVLQNQDLQNKILDLNRIGQLYEKGIDSQGKSLKDIGGSQFTASGYAPFTLKIKQEKGQRTDHITLKDTGDFYASFTITIGEDAFYIDANPVKDDTNLFTEWGEDIIGLTDESRDVLVEWIINELHPKIIEYLLT